MSKEEIEQLLAQSSEMPLFTNGLREIVEQIYTLRVNYPTECMGYELVGIILRMGERSYELETRRMSQTLWDDASELYRADYTIEREQKENRGKTL